MSDPMHPGLPSTTLSPIGVRFDDERFWVELDDSVLGVPIAWLPRLLAGSPKARRAVELRSRGLHRDDLDEDISVDGILAGYGDMTRRTLA